MVSLIFQFDESHLSEITGEVNQVLGKCFLVSF